MKKTITFTILCLIFITAGCTVSRPTIEDATANGAKQLGKRNIKNLVMDHELKMVSWDKSVEASVQFKSGGKLVGRNNIGEESHGRWSANSENKLCLKFRFWGNNIKHCYDVYKSNDEYLLFSNGMMENTLIPNEEILSSLEDDNVGVLGNPPPGSSKRISKKRKSVRKSSHKKDKSLLSTMTFGLLGGGEEEEPEEEDIPFKKEYVPEPMPVKKLSAQHQQLLDTGDCPECDLQAHDLTGMNLKGANLAGANLQGANLQETNLKGANLKGANLESARLTDSILINANLQGANLSDSNLHWADLSKANLNGANLTRSYMVKAIFYKADLTGANFSGAQTQRTIFEKATGVPEHILNRNQN